ncbi:MAG: IclR family transcriptional regulator [Bacillota bacterium]
MPNRKGKPDFDNETVRSVERTCDILFAFISPKPTLSLAEISETVKLPKTTTYRILRTLEAKGLVQQNEKTHEYSLGFKIFQLGSIVINQMDLRKVALPYMKDIAAKTGEAVSLNIVQEQSRVCIERIESQGIIRYYLPIGARSPLYKGATGKVLMAFLPEDEIEEIIKTQILYNPKAGNIKVDLLRKELADIRVKGYAYTVDELGVGISTVAAPIFNYLNNLVGCINISGPVSKFTSDKVDLYIELVKHASREISKLMGANVS